ncbi:MAG: ATP-binding protein [Thermoplasmatota archaeon]
MPFPSRFVGRKAELALLRGLLERAGAGEGCLALVEGEAGVGKTRLVNEILEDARSRGFITLQGRCAEGGGPYLPFVAAFSDTTTIEGLFLIYRDGRVIAHWSRAADFTTDAEVVSGMLSAIQDFIAQSFQGRGGGELKEVRHGDLEILVEHAPNLFLVAVVSGPRPLGLSQEMRGVLEALETRYGRTLEKWDGVVDRFSGAKDALRDLVALRRYGIEQMSGLREELELGRDRAGGEKERDRMFENLSRHISIIAMDKPLAIFLDDLQWMDTASLHLLHHIARTTRGSAVLLLCTCRPEDLEPGGPLARVLREMGRERLLNRVQLRRLEADCIREMVGAVYGTPPAQVPEEFVARIYEETEGNPFFVEEVLRSLVDEGVVDPRSPEWYQSTSLTRVNLPSSVEDIVLRRVDRLDGRGREVLGLAAVIGVQFDFELLRRVSGLDEMELASVLESMVGARLVSEGLRFDHGVIREVLYKRTPPFKLAVMHKRVGLALEELHARSPMEHSTALALHFSRAGVVDKAIEYSMMAARVAMAKHANEEALGHCRTALSFVERSGDRDAPGMRKKELSILMELVELSERASEMEGWMEYGRRAIELATSLHDHASLAASHLSLGDLYVRVGEWASALLHYGRSLEVARASGDSGALASAHRAIGNVHFRIGDYARAIEYHQKSIELAGGLEGGAGVPILVQTYIELANVHSERGDYALAVDFYQRAMDLGIRSGSMYDAATALNNIGDVYLKTEEFDIAREYFERALHIFRIMGTVMDIVVTLCNLAEAQAKSLRIQEAEAYCEEAKKLLKRIGEVELPFQLHLDIALIHRYRGEWESSREHFEAAIAALEGVNMPYYLGVAYYEMGLMHRDRGDAREAGRCFENALQILERVGARQLRLRVRSALGGVGD